MSSRSLRIPILAERSSAQRRWLAVAALLIVFAFILIRTAWMSDDAYITLRTVDNLIHGYGPTWNIAERVQGFTHPLWMLLLSAGYLITHEAYFTTIAISIVISFAVMWLLMTRIASSLTAGVVAAVALILSKAFIDYSTSGLENPLTHLLLAVFFAIYLADAAGPKKLFRLALVTALLAVNRIDAVLLVSLPFVLALIESRAAFRTDKLHVLGLLVLGFLPFVAWEIFSLGYYGFAVPNTAFAKLNTSIAETTLLRQGVAYLVQSTRVDIFTSLALIAGSVAALWPRKPRITAMVLAALLYVAYVVWIGGDFMSGRFLAAPLFCIVLAVAASGVIPDNRTGAGVLLAVLIVGSVAPHSPVRGDAFYPCGQGAARVTGVDDERGCYFDGTGLVRQKPGQEHTPSHSLFGFGLATRDDALRVQAEGAVGMYGYAAGPTLHVVDLNALSDPLMARLPMPQGKAWRIGHFERLVPAGYLESLVSGENRICNPGMREFYDHLKIITRGPLFTAERLSTIWKMNTGQYDGLLASYGNPDALGVQLCDAQAKTDLHFTGGPRLVGYSVGTMQPKAGSQLPVTLYWQRDDEHQVPLASFVHVRPSQEGQATNPHSDSGMWAQGEHFERAGRYTTEYWDGQVYVHQFLLDIPADTPAGIYNFEIGWFNTQTGDQLEPKPETITAPYKILWRSVLLPPLTVQ